MKKFKTFVKLIFYNILVFFSFLGLLFFIPPTSYFFLKPSQSHHGTLNLPNYKGVDWIETNLREFGELKIKYFDFVVWRREDFKGKTIEIKNGIRATYMPSVINSDTEYWFFGGSTMFGSGVPDNGTIPSVFAKLVGAKAVNFGESGWMARQQLAMLTNQYIKGVSKSKKYIIFYDGINNVGTNCRVDNDGLSTARQSQLQHQVKDMGSKFEFKRTFQQIFDFIEVVKRRFIIGRDYQHTLYDCHKDKNKANLAANSLVETWVTASKLAEANGDSFLAILQPSAHLGNANTSHLNLNEPVYKARGQQIKVVYPLIRTLAMERGINFIDLTDIYDGSEFIYTDTSHVTINGHERVSQAIKKHLQL